MSKPPRTLSAEEKRLWDGVAAGVRRRKPSAKAKPAGEAAASRSEAPRKQPAKPPPKLQHQPTRAKEHQRQPPAPQNVGGERKVQRGQIEIDAALDLHGHNQDTAPRMLVRFVVSARARGCLTLLVITGVGRGGVGVLRRRLPEWLAEPELAKVVKGYAGAHRTHGGDGAFYVFLRKAR